MSFPGFLTVHKTSIVINRPTPHFLSCYNDINAFIHPLIFKHLALLGPQNGSLFSRWRYLQAYLHLLRIEISNYLVPRSARMVVAV